MISHKRSLPQLPSVSRCYPRRFVRSACLITRARRFQNDLFLSNGRMYIINVIKLETFLFTNGSNLTWEENKPTKTQLEPVVRFFFQFDAKQSLIYRLRVSLMFHHPMSKIRTSCMPSILADGVTGVPARTLSIMNIYQHILSSCLTILATLREFCKKWCHFPIFVTLQVFETKHDPVDSRRQFWWACKFARNVSGFLVH